jgi:hypothetical protein
MSGVVSKATRNAVWMLCAAALLGAGVTACGGDSREATVIRIGGTSITNATLAHWIAVIAGEGSRAPLPEPPDYGACVANLRRSSATSSSASARPTSLELERQCAFDYEKYKLKALYFLIPYVWVNGAAAELGIDVTDTAAHEELAALKGRFANIRTFLVGTRGTVADMLMRIKLALLTSRIQRRLESQGNARHLTIPERQQALNAFGAQFREEWTARTSCSPGYVVAICKGFRRPEVASSLTPPSVPLTQMTAK